ncbi:MAG: hypothetical protein GC193_03890 [Cryomorphaceae bacterium]|nr:hypothetical protein [Cryomorphaceae bacterium]
MKKFALLCFFVGLTFVSAAQMALETRLTADQCSEDLKQLKSIILQAHTNPYTYCTKEQFDASFDMALDGVKEGATYSEFVKIVGRTVRIMRDSHTSVNFRQSIATYREEGGLFFNFRIWSVGDDLVVSEDREDRLPPGTIIERINGVNAKAIYHAVSDVSVFEGASISSFIRITDALYPQLLCLNINIKSWNDIQVRRPGDSISTVVRYPGRTSKQIEKFNKNKITHPVYDLNIDVENDLAVIKIGSFFYGGGGKYYRFLRRSFKEIKKSGVQRLAVDLRYNTGGNSGRMKSLLSYVANDSVLIPSNIIAKQSATSIEYFNRSFGGLARFYIRNFKRKSVDAQNYLRIAENPKGMQDTVFFYERSPLNKAAHFNGERFLFINGLSGSASVNFAAAFQSNGIGTVVGEPCLGPLDGTWGNPSPVKLKHSGLALVVSTIRFNTNNNFQVSARPIIPDVSIRESVIDLTNEVDPCVEYVKQRKRLTE